MKRKRNFMYFANQKLHRSDLDQRAHQTREQRKGDYNPGKGDLNIHFLL